MADVPDQRNELDDLLVILRKVQRALPDSDSVARAEAASKLIQGMIRKGSAMPAHVQIQEQLEERLAQLRGHPHRG